MRMPLSKEVQAHAKLVAKDVRAGKTSAHFSSAREFLEENPDAILTVIDLIHREANRKNSNPAMIQAYGLMFSNGLELLRYQIERGQDWAEALIDGARDSLLLLAEGGVIGPDLLMFLLNGFIEAKIEPGDDLTELLGEVMAEAAGDEAPPDPAEIGEIFDSIVEQAGGNVFDVHTGLAEVSQALPSQVRQVLIANIAMASNPVLRDTAVLSLLDPSSEVRRMVCQVIAENASSSLVSPVALRRMIALRNWLPENERAHLDAAIKKVRQQHVECASWPQRKVSEIIASNCDGAGAQSVFAVVQEGRKYLLASLLLKRGVGIADAWCLRDQTKAEVRGFLDQITSQTDSITVDMDFVQTLVAHHLSLGRKWGNVPPAGFLDFVEATGSETWQPSELSADDLIACLEQDLDPTQMTPETIDVIVNKSDGWLEEFHFMDSWFEEDAEVQAVLSRMPRSRAQTKINAILTSILEPRRGKWVELFLWTALWLKQKPDLLTPWKELFIVGRELRRGRSVKDIPIMRSIAGVTVEAAAALPY